MVWHGGEDSHPSKVFNGMDSHLCVFFSKKNLADSHFLHFIAVLSVGMEED